MAHRVVVVAVPDTHKTYTQVGTIIHPTFNNNDYPTPGLFIKNPTEHVIKLNPADQKSRHVTKCGSFALRKVMVSSAYYSRYVSKNEVKHLLYEIQCEKNSVLGLAVEICKHFPLFNRKDGAEENINKSECHIHFSSVSLNEGEIKDLNAMIDGVRCAQRLRDTPAEEMNTKDLAQEAIKIGIESENMSVEIVKGEQLKARGFGGIYAVAKGADRDGYMVRLTIEGSDPNASPCAIVAKGIVYDCGGLGLKPVGGMFGMKGDMGGAASLAGACLTLAKMNVKPKSSMHFIFCIAENAIGPNAMRNDDIILQKSGKTVEVNHTDAEGRIVMGDGVAYATFDLGVKTIWNIATLTGAGRRDNGNYHGCLVTNDEELEKMIFKAGLYTGDMVHPMVYAPECHFHQYNSIVADFQNSVGAQDNAATSCGAYFVQAHMKGGFHFDGKWAHLDYSGCATFKELGKQRSTGYLCALIVASFAKLAGYETNFDFTDF